MKATLGNVFFVGAPTTYFTECDVGQVSDAARGVPANAPVFEILYAQSGTESFKPCMASVTDISVARARRLDPLRQLSS